MFLTRLIIILTIFFSIQQKWICLLFFPILFFELNNKLINLYRVIILIISIFLALDKNLHSIFVFTTMFLLLKTNLKKPKISYQYVKWLNNADISFLKKHLNKYFITKKEWVPFLFLFYNKTEITIIVVIYFLTILFWNIKSKKNQLSIYYDDNCYFCLKALYTISQLIQNNKLLFKPNNQLTKRNVEMNKLNINKFMYVEIKGKYYAGYHAFIQIFSTLILFRIFKPFFNNTLSIYIGEKVYEKISSMRGTQIVCKIN